MAKAGDARVVSLILSRMQQHVLREGNVMDGGACEVAHDALYDPSLMMGDGSVYDEVTGCLMKLSGDEFDEMAAVHEEAVTG